MCKELAHFCEKVRVTLNCFFNFVQGTWFFLEVVNHLAKGTEEHLCGKVENKQKKRKIKPYILS